MSRYGTFKMKGRQRFLSQALAGETIAFEEVADGVWALHVCTLELSRFDERVDQLKPWTSASTVSPIVPV